MQRKAGLGISIALSILAFFIGIGGIVILIGVGEASNNTIMAFIAVSFPYALLAGFFSWIAPRARWAIGIAMSTPQPLAEMVYNNDNHLPELFIGQSQWRKGVLCTLDSLCFE